MRSAEATDDQERIYIGGKSKYNGGDAVLEIHNLDDKFKDIIYGENNASAAVINGDLIVMGTIYNAVEDYYKMKKERRLNMLVSEANIGGESQALFLGRHVIDVEKHPAIASDRRLKYVGTENKSGLDKIRQLKVFNYTFKKDKEKTPHVGVIAQDLQKIFPDAVTKGDDGFLRIRMEDMFYALVNAVKELDAKITELTNQVKILQEQNKYIIKQNKQIMQENKEIKARLKAIEAAR